MRRATATKPARRGIPGLSEGVYLATEADHAWLSETFARMASKYGVEDAISIMLAGAMHPANRKYKLPTGRLLRGWLADRYFHMTPDADPPPRKEEPPSKPNIIRDPDSRAKPLSESMDLDDLLADAVVELEDGSTISLGDYLAASD